MKTYILKQLLAIFVGIFCLTPYSFAELKSESVYPTIGKLGQSLNVTLTGKGFDAGTRVSFFPDSGNKKSIIGSLDIQGSTSGVRVIGNIAYVSAPNKGLQIIDISMPSKPRLIGSVATSYASGIAVAGTTAYIADWDKGLKVIDVSDLTSPKIIGSVDTSGIAVGVMIAGNIAYMADSDAGLQVIDVSNPSAPTILSTLDTPGSVSDITVVNNIAYIAEYWDGGLRIADVSIPSSPKSIGYLAMPSEAHGVTVVGNAAYVADGKSGLQIIDVGNPSMPRILGSAATPADAAQVTVIGNTAYVAAWESGLQIIDVQIPSSPKIIGFADTPSNACEVAVAGNTAYAADGSGLQIIDVSHPVSSELLGSVNTPGWANSLTIIGNFTYVADGNSLQIINISNPLQPVIVSTVNIGTSSAVVIGNIAYVTTGKTGLFLIDISNPYAPVIIGSTDTPGEAQDVSVVGTTAYVADKYNGLQIIDVSTPSSPKIIGSVIPPNYQTITPDCKGVAVAGTTAYVTAWPSGLIIIDVSNPSAPKILSSSEMYGDPQKVRVIGNTAYVINGLLKIVDVSNSYAPQLLSSLTTSGYSENITLIGTTAYIADWKRGISVADVSNPSNPVIIGSVDTPGIASDVRILNDKAYVADGNAGLTIVPLPVEIRPVSLINPTSLFITLPSPEISGNYTIRVFNSSESCELTGSVTFLNPDSYQIQAQEKAIVIAGRKSQDDPLWKYTKMNADYAYNTLLFQGYTRENIYYLRSESEDVDGNGLSDDVDADATYDNFQYAVNVWAKNPSTHGLLIYMIDHGSMESFKINPDESLSAQDMDSWLDGLSLPGKIIVIYDACRSGSFLSMTPPSGQTRIVITSTSENQPAIFQDNGEFSFSFWFWNSVARGYNLGSAFLRARENMSAFQTALISDQTLANDISVGRHRVSGPTGPKIVSFSADKPILNGEFSATIRADIESSNSIEYVRVVIIPPNYGTQSPDTPVTDLPETELQFKSYDGKKYAYEKVCDDFTQTGIYTITIYAKDKETNEQWSESDISLSITVEQKLGTLKGDINGDGAVDLKDAIIVLRVLAGIGTNEIRPGYAASGADVNGNSKAGLEELVYILQKIAVLR